MFVGLQGAVLGVVWAQVVEEQAQLALAAVALYALAVQV
jgi:flavin-binding protein dodecin